MCLVVAGPSQSRKAGVVSREERVVVGGENGKASSCGLYSSLCPFYPKRLQEKLSKLVSYLHLFDNPIWSDILETVFIQQI